MSVIAAFFCGIFLILRFIFSGRRSVLGQYHCVVTRLAGNCSRYLQVVGDHLSMRRLYSLFLLASLAEEKLRARRLFNARIPVVCNLPSESSRRADIHALISARAPLSFSLPFSLSFVNVPLVIDAAVGSAEEVPTSSSFRRGNIDIRGGF